MNAYVVAFEIQSIGLSGMSYFFDLFYCMCLFTVDRSAGSSITGIYSLILFKSSRSSCRFSKKEDNH